LRDNAGDAFAVEDIAMPIAIGDPTAWACSASDTIEPTSSPTALRPGMGHELRRHVRGVARRPEGVSDRPCGPPGQSGATAVEALTVAVCAFPSCSIPVAEDGPGFCGPHADVLSDEIRTAADTPEGRDRAVAYLVLLTQSRTRGRSCGRRHP
jgi:hypothetical protein